MALGFISLLPSQAGQLAAISNQAPSINGTVVGNIQQNSASSASLNSSASISGNWYVPGTPTVNLNGTPHFGGTVQGTGSAQPTNYSITLNSGSTLQNLVTRTNAVNFATVNSVESAGTTSVNISSSSQVSSINFSTLLNLTLNSNVGNVTVPPGNYGSFNLNSGTQITLGSAQSPYPTEYSFSQLTFNSSSQLILLGPVIITVQNGINVNASCVIGNPAHPAWCHFRIVQNGLTINSNGTVYGAVEAPTSSVNINGNMYGEVISCNQLSINSGASLQGEPMLESVLNVYPARGTSPLQISADGSMSTGGIVSYQWDFGDQTSGTGAQVTHTYSNNGDYLVTLVVTDASGNFSAASELVSVGSSALGAEYYPLALPQSSLTSVQTGQNLTYTFAGDDSSHIAWLSWSGQLGLSPLVQSFVSPGNAQYYVNPDNPFDHFVQDGDLIYGFSSQADSSSQLQNTLNALVGQTLTVPIFDQVQQFTSSGQTYYLYHMVGAASVKLVQFTEQGTQTNQTVVLQYLGSSTSGTASTVPTISWTQPTTGTIYTYNNGVQIPLQTSGTAGTGSQLARVDYFASGANGIVSLGQSTTAPYSFTWNPTVSGQYYLTAVAVDADGRSMATSPISVILNVPPSVSIATSSTVIQPGSSATITIAASDSDGTVASVTLYENDGTHGLVKLAQFTSPPYTYTWQQPPAGLYSLTAVAVDNDGASTTSSPITLDVNAPPTANLTTSAVNGIDGLNTPLQINSGASDPSGTVASVQFYVNGQQVGQSTTAPFDYSWVPTAPGSYQIYVVVTDNHGAVTTSPTTTVQIDAPPTAPTLNLVASGDVSDTISWSASTDTNGVSGYQLYRNGQLLRTTTALEDTDTGLSPSTTYSYTVVATDSVGLVSSPSNALSVTTSASTLPTPWTHSEIGSIAYAGSASFSGTTSTFTLSASGIDIGNSADSFGFVDQSVSGNTQITAQVVSQTAPSQSTKSGVMIRATTDPGSPEVSIFVTPGNGVIFESRTAQGATTTSVAGSLTAKAPLWVDLVLSGTQVTGAYSTDGIDWTTIGQATLPQATSELVGLASTSDDNGVLATSTFTNVQVSTTTTLPTIPSSWLQQYFGSAPVNFTSLSPAGDGYTIAQEYLMGRNPLDYYQGKVPTISIISGNNQTGAARSILPTALTILISDSTGNPLNNAPVTFNASAGQLLATATASSGASSLSARTNAQGQASVYFQLPSQGAVTIGAAVAINQTAANPSGQTNTGATFNETCQSGLFLFAGGDSSFSITSTGTYGWGADSFGQALVSPVQSALTTPTPTGLTPLAIVSSGNHTLILKADHSVSAVGDNYFGQLGVGDQVDRSLPTPIPGLANVVALATGREHSLALLSNGTVYAWGGNSSGQLGQAVSSGSLVPVQVAGLQNIVAISSGQLHCLALDSSGNVYAWGDGRFGQLGNGATTNLTTPTQIGTLTSISGISAGDFTSFAYNKSGNAWSWGCNSSGALGQGNQTDSSTPQPISIAGQLISQINAGSEFTLILTSTGNLYGAGANFAEQIDSAASGPATSPVALSLAGVLQIATGNDHALIQTQQGIFSWGLNQLGQLGTGTTTNSTSTAITVP